MANTLLVHAPDYSNEELLLSGDVLNECGLAPGDFVELSLKEPKPIALVLRVPALTSTGTKSAVRVSLSRLVADAFGLTARQPVVLRAVKTHEAALEWVELTFRDQHLSRGDIWHFRRHLVVNEPTMYLGKTISFEHIRAQVTRMMREGSQTSSGVFVDQTKEALSTKLRFRSRSAAFVMLLQVSAEMSAVDAASGELYHEKAIRFLRALFRRWKTLGVSHSVTIVLFCRCYADGGKGSGATRGGAATGGAMPAPSANPALGSDGELMRDGAGRRYSDYYKLVAENESRADWEPLLPTLKRQILSFGPSLKRREQTASAMTGGAPPPTSPASGGLFGGGLGGGWGGGLGGGWGGGLGGGLGGGFAKSHGSDSESGSSLSMQNSSAAQGNLLEAINLALDVLESSYEEQVIALGVPSESLLKALLGCPPWMPSLDALFGCPLWMPSLALLGCPLNALCSRRGGRTSRARASRSSSSRRAPATSRWSTGCPRSRSRGSLTMVSAATSCAAAHRRCTRCQSSRTCTRARTWTCRARLRHSACRIGCSCRTRTRRRTPRSLTAE
jgi:hypothetical protein